MSHSTGVTRSAVFRGSVVWVELGLMMAVWGVLAVLGVVGSLAAGFPVGVAGVVAAYSMLSWWS